MEHSPLKLNKKCLLCAWSVWERVYHRVHRLELGHNDDLLYFKIKPYRGSCITLSDGEMINHGDLIIELHFNNHLLLKAALQSKNNIQLATTLVKSMRETLKRMASYIHTDKRRTDIKGLYGISILHKGAEQFGFNVLDLPNRWPTNFQRLYLLTLLQVVHPYGKKRVRRRTPTLTPKIIAVSRKSFETKVDNMD